MQSLCRMADANVIATCYLLHLQQTPLVEPSVESTDMVALLEEFESIFVPPQGLPPTRQNDHAIHLQPDVKLVNVHPYRYPYFQKAEVKRQVQQMLD